jgi:16S rRNA (guanine1516-N2)-methyltransferase
MAELIVTTSYHPTAGQIEEAHRLARRLQAELVERGDQSVSALRGEHRDAPVLVVRRDRLVCQVGELEFFFHPSLAKQRIAGLRKGERDPMVQAMELRSGDRVLDCTLGLGADAIVVSYCVGPAGEVIGLESVAIIAEIVSRGLREFRSDLSVLNEAMPRVGVVCADHLEHLQAQASDSFDIVYFDPMFATPLYGSRPLLPLRKLADHRHLRPEAIGEATRVARRRVVVKSKRGSTLWHDFGISMVHSGTRSHVEFGVIPKEPRQ